MTPQACEITGSTHAARCLPTRVCVCVFGGNSQSLLSLICARSRVDSIDPAVKGERKLAAVANLTGDVR